MIGNKVRSRRPAAPAPGRWAGVTTMLLAVVQAALIAWFTFSLSGKLDVAVKERQTTLQAAGAMAALISEMQDVREQSEYRVRVRKIAMYGADAIQPLTMMSVEGPSDQDIPINGLKLLAIHHREAICESVGKAADSAFVSSSRIRGLQQFQKDLKC